VSPPLRRGSIAGLPTPVLRYAVAAASVGLAVLLMLALSEVTGVQDARPALLVAIAFSALNGGLGPGLLALALSTLAAHDPVVVAAGAILAALCARFKRPHAGPPSAAPGAESAESSLRAVRSPGGQVQRRSRPQPNAKAAQPALREITTEATWRFHHEQPLDITLPEDEQVEHLYMYSVLAECNDAFARMYGFRAAADVVGTRLVVFLPPANAENVAYLRSFIRSGYRLEDAESHEIDRYGHSKHFVNNLVGIFERGQLVGAWGTQRDVTEQKRSAEAQEYSTRLHSTKSSSP
jgi:PAS domain S-box-containing protein